MKQRYLLFLGWMSLGACGSEVGPECKKFLQLTEEVKTACAERSLDSILCSIDPGAEARIKEITAGKWEEKSCKTMQQAPTETLEERVTKPLIDIDKAAYIGNNTISIIGKVLLTKSMKINNVDVPVVGGAFSYQGDVSNIRNELTTTDLFDTDEKTNFTMEATSASNETTQKQAPILVKRGMVDELKSQLTASPSALSWAKEYTKGSPAPLLVFYSGECGHPESNWSPTQKYATKVADVQLIVPYCKTKENALGDCGPYHENRYPHVQYVFQFKVYEAKTGKLLESKEVTAKKEKCPASFTFLGTSKAGVTKVLDTDIDAAYPWLDALAAGK
jgi:hypothetical protein